MPRSSAANYPYEVLTCRAIFEIRLPGAPSPKSLGFRRRSVAVFQGGPSRTGGKAPLSES
jgi:hypothetical protein